MLCTRNLKVRLEGTLTSLENDLQHVNNEIHALNKKIDAVQQKLKACKKEGKMATKDAITKQIEKLHFEHKTQSMPLKQEKVLLREIENLKAGIRTCQENAMLEESVRKMLNQRHELIEKRKIKTNNISEANMGLQKLKLVEYCGISPGDLVSTTLSVDKDKVKHVMGRQYATLKRLEEEHHVVVEERKHKADVSSNAEGGNADGEQADVLIITGTTENCNVAKYHIDQIARRIGETVNVGEDIAAVLKLQQSGTEQTHADFIGLASGATIVGSPKKYSILIQGTPEAIEKAKNMIQSINYCSTPMVVDARDLPAVLGTRGTTIRRLEKDHNVRINIKREAISIDKEEDGTSGDEQQNSNNLGSPREISILGATEDVNAALKSIEAVLSDNELIEKCIELPCAYLAPLLRNLSKGGLRDIEREVRFIRLYICDDEGEYGIIRCSGTKYKVAEALPLVYASASIAQSLTERVDVSPNIMGAIIGKKGKMIKNMREAHPAVEILLDMARNSVFFHSADEPARMAVRKALMEVVSTNQFNSVELGSDVALLLKMKSSTKIRGTIEALNVRMDIGKGGAGTIGLRGEMEAVQEAIKKLLEFKANNQLEIFRLDPENVNAFPATIFNELRQNKGVSVQLFKDKQELHLHGIPEQLVEARKYVHHYLYGDEEGSVTFVNFQTEVSGLLIGKGGNRIMKMQEDWGVSLEIVDHTRNPKVRLRGDPKKVADAKAKLTTFIENTSITSTVDISSIISCTHSGMLAHCETVGNMFKIAVLPDQKGKHIQLKGMARKIGVARSWLLALLTGKACIILPISGAINTVEEAVFATERLNVELNNTDQSSGDTLIKLVSGEDGFSISVEGEPSAVQRAVQMSYKVLESSFQGRFASVSVGIGVLDLSIGKPRTMKTAVEATEGEVEIFADWAFDCVRVRGKNADSVSAAVETLEAVAKAWMASNAIVTFEKWMAPLIIGKHGSSIKDFSEKHSVMVRIDQHSLSCFITDPQKSQNRAFTDLNSGRVSPMISKEDGGGPSGVGDSVIHAGAHALRKITDKMYKTNGCPLPDPQGIFAQEKGSEALKGVEKKTGVSCIRCMEMNSVLILGDKAAVLEARTALKEMMERGLEEQEQNGESSESGVHPPSTTHSRLLSKGGGDVSVTSPPSLASELSMARSPVRLEHPVIGKFGAAEGGITTSSHEKAAGYVNSSHPVSEFHHQTEKPSFGVAAVVIDAHRLAHEKEKEKQGSDHLPSMLFGEANLSINAVSENRLPGVSTLPDSSNVAVRGCKTIGSGNDSEEPAVHEEKGSWYFRLLNGLNVRLS